jgi:uncharacterized protein (DUF488 family)
MSQNSPASSDPVRLYTIGFAGKSAQEFFGLLQRAGIKRMVDIRLNNVSQLAGFTKKADLEYFLKAIAGIEYIHLPSFSPTKSILDAYKDKQMSWSEYERQFKELLEDRRPDRGLVPTDFDMNCLLCSEPTAEQCHRRLTAEYLRKRWGGSVTITHL